MAAATAAAIADVIDVTADVIATVDCEWPDALPPFVSSSTLRYKV
ncbi:MAG TPA: hypothetical protein VGM50_00045 [Gemmatimonadaceae bacterium]